MRLSPGFRHLSPRRLSTAAAPVDSVVVDTPSGKLRGSRLKSCLGDCYHAFRGIPYARPPVASLRFRDPEPAEPWSGVRDALSHGPISLQYDARARLVRGSEDCLYANVYARELAPGRPSAVLVWVHGGYFAMRSGDDFGPDYLLAADVLLVTFNYRLGVLGFLNLEDEAASGNQGLKDQAMLLRWVRTHISSFGGDPDNVTVFGVSTGSVSTHLLGLSPLSRDLFHKAILMSGSALNLWSTAFEPGRSARSLLRQLGASDEGPGGALAFLRSVDGKRLIEAQERLFDARARLQLRLPFGPGIDDKSDEPFMPTHPWLAAERAVRKPLIAGCNSLEGIIFLRDLEKLDLADVNANLEEYLHPRLPQLLKHYGLAFEELRRLYLSDEDVTELNVEKLVQLLSDLHCESVFRLMKLQRRGSDRPTYLYKFSFDKNVGIVKRAIKSRFNDKFKRGVCHGDEQTYLFRSRIDETSAKQLADGTGADEVRKRMVELWANFAKTGSPTPVKSELMSISWQPLNDNDLELDYLNIDEELRMEKIILEDAQKYPLKNCTARYLH